MPGSSSPDGGRGALAQPSDGVTLPAALGRYRVLRLLGEGAMGRVLLAHDPVLDREVALKHLRDDLRIPRDVREQLVVRMRHEARAAARVTHPNLVTLHDVGEDPDFGLYLVFEYVEGLTLKQHLAERPLSAAQAARLARELGEALTIAHRAGIVHRDIKPENIILSTKGGKIADFGIARIPDSTLTHQGGLMGTPAYSAPETFRAGRFSPESDQFSLAAVMYEAISGRRAFPGDDAVSVASKIASDEPPPIARELCVPPSLDHVLARGMCKRPEDRYPSCEAFGAAFADCLAWATSSQMPRRMLEAPAAAALPSEPDALRADLGDDEFPPRERKTGQVILGAAVVVATALLLVRTALRSSDAPEEHPAAAATAAPAVSSSPAPPRPRASPPARPARPKPDPDDAVSPAPRATGSAGTGEASASAPGDAESRPASIALPEPERAGDAGAPHVDEPDVDTDGPGAPETDDPGAMGTDDRGAMETDDRGAMETRAPGAPETRAPDAPETRAPGALDAGAPDAAPR
ncbi:protein kinase [Sorangium cellulosum]|uniref:Protein kinase n=1 Tax=Sorangium cellulosum TaxID=56 RepID=A0A4P2Q1R8_SORCE|nr:serine/threonine-protein kinase [Sorangium cellulosum]AUX23031.1 protein kinase [Sorangium cellulosum]